jgi:3-oxoadipate enol-lactonase
MTVSLQFTERGVNVPVILLHGFPLNNTIWASQLRDLHDMCRLIAPDLRGHGASHAPQKASYDMESMANDVLALMDTLALPKAAVIGHSMGGYVALAMWRLAPERITGFGLVGSHAWADTDEGRQARLKLAEKLVDGNSAAVADAMMPKMFAAPAAEDPEMVTPLREMMLKTPQLTAAGCLRGMASRPDSTALLPEITVPSLVLVGQHDQIVSRERAQTMAAAMPHCLLIEIEGAGHMPMLEQPAATSFALRQFLSSLDPYKR